MPLNIDWQQILLHLFNFFLLLAILTHFVYEPVLAFMKKRQEHFKEIEDNYENKNREVDKLIDKNKKMFENTDSEIKEYKAKRIEEVSNLVQEKINEANKESDRIIEQAKKKADLEYKKVLENANKDIRKMAVEATKKLVYKDKDDFDDFVDHFQMGDEDNE